MGLKFISQLKAMRLNLSFFTLAFKRSARIIKGALISTGIGAFFFILGEAFTDVYENWDSLSKKVNKGLRTPLIVLLTYLIIYLKSILLKLERYQLKHNN